MKKPPRSLKFSFLRENACTSFFKKNTMELTFNTQKKMHFIFYHFLRGDAPHVSQKGRLSGWGSHADSIFKNVTNFVARCTDGQKKY